jgi:hypothetical protein
MYDITQVPARIEGPSAWYGPDMARDQSWIELLAPAEIAEIDAAVRAVSAAGVDIAQMRKEDFPLPTFAPRLARIVDDVLNGRGFALLRGFNLAPYGMKESATAFFGLGSHIGPARSQNGKGHILGHVQDLGLSSSQPSVRIYQTNERQTYHTDSSDIVALMCVRPAKSGGLSSLVSSVTIYNEMRRRAPALARLLFEPIETDRRGEVKPGQKPYFRIPVFNWHAWLLSAIYQRQYIDSSRRFAELPPFTAEQTAALDLFDELANDPALYLHMEFRPGDIQLVHNHTLLHDRTAFIDWAEPERKRHLLRLWLAPESARPLPPAFAERYGDLTPGARGGVAVPESELRAPLTAA